MSIDAVFEKSIEKFLFMEARLQDEHRYDEWDALWTEDALYWVPANDDNADPTKQVSYIYDNRSRIGSRVRQLKSGHRHAQSPQSRMRRLISNMEVMSYDSDGVNVEANFLLIEVRHGEQNIWAGRTLYVLAREGEGFKMKSKKVLLANNAEPIRNLAFLI
ncbi:aromatic-ring-hydroxylating dioxygenase subunit beta [soil metagenome]